MIDVAFPFNVVPAGQAKSQGHVCACGSKKEKVNKNERRGTRTKEGKSKNCSMEANADYRRQIDHFRLEAFEDCRTSDSRKDGL